MILPSLVEMVVVRRLQQVVARLVVEAEVRKHDVLEAGDGAETERRRLIVDCREEDASTFVRFVRSEQEGPDLLLHIPCSQIN